MHLEILLTVGIPLLFTVAGAVISQFIYLQKEFVKINLKMDYMREQVTQSTAASQRIEHENRDLREKLIKLSAQVNFGGGHGATNGVAYEK